jgi:hypothetical protein
MLRVTKKIAESTDCKSSRGERERIKGQMPLFDRKHIFLFLVIHFEFEI